MSVLGRYKKTGGFSQLLNLIETCGMKKRENLLRIISEESEVWADEIKTKMITIDKVFAWPDEALLEIFAHVQGMTLALAFQSVKEDSEKERLLGLLDHATRRTVMDDMEKEFSTSEIGSGITKILVATRQMIGDGQLRVEKFAPDLVVARGIEEELEQKSKGLVGDAGASQKLLHAVESSIKVEKDKREKDNSNIKVIQSSFEQLKNRIIKLEKENDDLLKEVTTMKAKLDKIKRIA